MDNNIIFCGDCEAYLRHINWQWTEFIDLVITSPPYAIGKAYETKQLSLSEYVLWQDNIIDLLVDKVKDTGSIVWQVGNYVKDGEIWPLDIEIAPLFKKRGWHLRNRIIWAFGHGLHCKHRFSGRYETALWFTKTDDYTFNLDAVRVPSKYPGKKYFKGPRKGELSGNPLGKNPGDIWDNIPNVKNNHVEKTNHPCQFPIGLAERFVLALSNPGDIVLDPFAGVGSTACAAAIHGRLHHSCEIVPAYCQEISRRVDLAMAGKLPYRKHTVEIFKPNPHL